jgi:hypothetical protein
MLFIQQIRTIYGPHERGGVAAQRRARVPLFDLRGQIR